MKKWGFGIVGAGSIAATHARVVCDIDNAQLIGFCDGGSGRAVKLAEEFSCRAFDDYQQMVDSEEVDAIAIATPSGLHLEPTVAAAKAGKHVLCEKPLEVTLDRVDEMIAAHDKAGTILGGIFQGRFCSALAELKQAIDEGRFGTITYAGAYVPWWRDDAYYEDAWRGTWKLDGGGALMNQSIHSVDAICYLMGDIDSVQAFSERNAHPQIETEDTTVAAVRFASGALGVIYGSTGAWPGQKKRIEISGTKGTVVLEEDSFSVWQFADEMPEDDDIRQRFSGGSDLGGASDPATISNINHKRNFEAFIVGLNEGKSPFLDGKEARRAVEVVLGIYESAAEQRCVKL